MCTVMIKLLKDTLGKDVRDGLINIEKKCKEKIELEILKKRW